MERLFYLSCVQSLSSEMMWLDSSKAYNLFPSLGKTTVGVNCLASSKSMWA